MLVVTQIQSLLLFQPVEVVVVPQLVLGCEPKTSDWHNLAVNFDCSDHIGQSVDLQEVQRRHFYLLILVRVMTLLFLSL
jgi:hypothetical protein